MPLSAANPITSGPASTIKVKQFPGGSASLPCTALHVQQQGAGRLIDKASPALWHLQGPKVLAKHLAIHDALQVDGPGVVQGGLCGMRTGINWETMCTLST